MEKIIILMVILLPLFSYAQNPSKEEVKKVAINAFKMNNKGKSTRLKELIPIKDSETGETLIYAVPYEKDGYALISNSKTVIPLLGTTNKGKFNLDSIPSGLKYLISKYKKGIKHHKYNDIKQSGKVKTKWDNYLDKKVGYTKEDIQQMQVETTSISNYTVGDTLVKTEWGQQFGYNDYLPSDYLVGCTAVAMAQILHYWNCKIEPTGSKTNDGEFANFGITKYYWGDMGLDFPEHNNKLLLSHSSIACETNW